MLQLSPNPHWISKPSLHFVYSLVEKRWPGKKRKDGLLGYEPAIFSDRHPSEYSAHKDSIPVIAY